MNCIMPLKDITLISKVNASKSVIGGQGTSL